MRLRQLTIALLLFYSVSGQAEAILWKSSSPKPKTQSRFSYDRTDEAREVADFWSQRKMAVGIATAGAYGLGGGVVAIHFHPQWNVDLGFGGGSHFQAYGFRIKKQLLVSSQFNPYIGAGFTRWHRNNSRPFNAADISPGFVAREFLEETERQQGIIDEKLIHGTLGLQYTFTNGSWKGYGLYLEALFLLSVEDFDSTPTGSLGFNYFF